MKAMSTEMFPMCGMDQCTVDYLLAAMAYHFKNMMWLLSVFQESRLHLLHRKEMKDRAYDLKERSWQRSKNSK